MSNGGVVISAPSSRCGKTTVTLGLLRALKNGGRKTRSFKVGPDYIDPAYHAAASGRPCVNLDTWATPRETIEALAFAETEETEMAVAEGALGLFDGAINVDAPLADGSAASLAALTGWPVALVVPTRGLGVSVAALVNGFSNFRPDVRIGGVIFNNVGSERHADLLRAAVERYCPGVVVLGCLNERAALRLPERHLGLVQAGEHPDLEAFLNEVAASVEAGVDLTALLSLAASAAEPHGRSPGAPCLVPPPGQRIAAARDDAFAFSYAAVLNGWRAAGAEVSFFSPLKDEPPDADADAVFLSGGYPELHAGRIAASSRFIDGVRAAAGRGAVVYGECGGYMVLGDGLTDAAGERHGMIGLLDFSSSFKERKRELGYRQARLLGQSWLGSARSVYRGHEFHYATTTDGGRDAPLFETTTAGGVALGPAGHVRGAVSGSFVHLIAARTGES